MESRGETPYGGTPWWRTLALRAHLLCFPPGCRSCGRLMNPLASTRPGFPYLCEDCFAALPWKYQARSCPRCYAWTPEPEAGDRPDCAGRGLAVERVRAACFYDDPVRRWMWGLKYNRVTALSHTLGALLAAHGPAADVLTDADAVVPVPLHPRRLRQRGFNHAHLLAHDWLRHLRGKGIPTPPLFPDVLRRTRHTPPQASLPAGRRRDGVTGAFAVAEAHAAVGDGSSRVAGWRVVLVDDIMTTGATVDACARALLHAGADRVDAVVLARA